MSGQHARLYLVFVIIAPLLAVFAFTFDGVYIGATLGARHAQPDGAVADHLSFGVVRAALIRQYGPYGVRWLAHYAARGGLEALRYPSAAQGFFPENR